MSDEMMQLLREAVDDGIERGAADNEIALLTTVGEFHHHDLDMLTPLPSGRTAGILRMGRARWVLAGIEGDREVDW